MWWIRHMGRCLIHLEMVRSFFNSVHLPLKKQSFMLGLLSSSSYPPPPLFLSPLFLSPPLDFSIVSFETYMQISYR